MRYYGRRGYVLLMALLCTCTVNSFAETQPKFTLVPQTPTSLTLFKGEEGLVTYLVTNQTNITRTLTMTPIEDVAQVTLGADVCANPFTLQSHQSCLLKLKITGGATVNVATPELCKTMSATNNSPDHLLCSRSSPENALQVSVESSRAYLTNSAANTVTMCSLNTSTAGDFLTDCQNAGASDLSTPAGIALSKIDGAVYLYIINSATASITACKIDRHRGFVTSCFPPFRSSALSDIQDVAVSAGNDYLYVNNASPTNNIVRCSLNLTGDEIGGLDSCYTPESDASFNSPQGIALDNTGTHVYVANNLGNSITRCGLIGFGDTTECVATSLASISSTMQPSAVALNSAGNILYVADSFSNYLVQCAVSAVEGLLSDCQGTSSGYLNQPSGLGVNYAGTQLLVANAPTGIPVAQFGIPSSSLDQATFLSQSNVASGNYGIALLE